VLHHALRLVGVQIVAGYLDLLVQAVIHLFRVGGGLRHALAAAEIPHDGLQPGGSGDEMLAGGVVRGYVLETRGGRE
jgi:hypothetical protein